MRWIVAILVIALGGCGGSGGGSSDSSGVSTSSPTGTSSVPPTSTPSSSLSLPGTQLSVSAYANNLAPYPTSVTVTVTNPPTDNFTYQVTTSGSAVLSANFSWQSSASGTLTITYPSPGKLGPGTYSGNVQLMVCADTACLNPIPGSPATLALTYVVYAGTQPPPSFSFTQGPTSIQSPLYTSQTANIIDDVSMSLTNVPSSALWIRVTQPSSGYVIGLDLAPYSGADTVLRLTLKSPSTLGSGIFTGSATFNICYDQDCQSPVAGSPVVIPLHFVVSLTAGVEYNLKNVPLIGVSDVAWSAADQRLYATTISAGGAMPASLVEIDPVAGAPVSSLSFPVDLYHLALSDDGQFGYVSSKDQPTVYRVQLPGLTSDLQIALDTQQLQPKAVYQMQVAPGSPRTLAVSFSGGGDSIDPTAVAIFDDAVERPSLLQPLPQFGEPASIAWGASASQLYAVRFDHVLPTDLRELDIANVDSNGLSVATSFPIALSDPLGPIWYAGGRIYGSDAVVRDAATNATLGQLTIPDGYQIITLVPDVPNARIFVLAHDLYGSRLYLFCYDTGLLLLRSVTDLGYDETTAYPVSLITWGANGAAFTSSENTLVVMSGSFQNSGSGSSISVAHRSVSAKLPAVKVVLPRH